MDFTTARTRLIDNLDSEITDKRVLAAMSGIPRELFVPVPSRHLAYEDIPLPIGLEQTISQPFIIALMTQALALTGVETVLEIGTGSGYQTAVLAELARRVVTVERLPALSATARKVLDDQGYRNIEMHSATETLGWPDGAPYDAILVTAGAPRVPPDLLAQLALGGRLVIPVGTRHIQELQKFTRREKKNLVENLGGCRFVSLIGKSAWEEAKNG